MPGDSDALPRQPKRTGAFAVLAGTVGLSLATSLIYDTRADEGEKLKAYPDVGKVWTICNGTTRGVKPGATATPEQCDALTAADLLIAVRGVETCAPVLKNPARHNQLRAAVRMNNNTGAFCRGWWKKRPSPGQIMQRGDLRGGCLEFLRYDLVRGRPVRGLTDRRRREARMCLDGL